jgi:hypothetical protein
VHDLEAILTAQVAMGFTSKILAWRRARAELGEATLLAKNPPRTAAHARINVVRTSLYPQAFEQQLPYIDLVWSWPFAGEFIGTLVTHLWYRPVATRNGADVELFPLAQAQVEGGTSAVLRLQLNPPNRWRGDWL